jgi:hypothetical protein
MKGSLGPDNQQAFGAKRKILNACNRLICATDKIRVSAEAES